MNFKNTLYIMSIIGLFVFGMMAFLITTQLDNNISESLIDDDRINQTYGDLNEKLQDSKAESERSYGNFSKTPPTEEFGEVQVSSVLSITDTAKSLTTGIWTILIRLPLTILGLPEVVTDIIGALLLFTLVIGLWLLWRGASS